MKKVYVLAPLAGLLLFGGFYWKHARLHELRLVEIRRQEAESKRQKITELESAQARAHEQAAALLAKRNQERADKERLDEAHKQERAELERRRMAALEQSRRLRPQLDRMRHDLEQLRTVISRGEERTRELQQERQFLADYIKRAESNRDSFHHLLHQLEAIERRSPSQPAPPREHNL